MKRIDEDCFAGFGDFGVYSSDPFTSNQSTSPPLGDPDVDWSVFENAGQWPEGSHPHPHTHTLAVLLERYLLRDDSAWITRLSKDFWWNLERISEMITSEVNLAQQMNQNGNINRSSLPTQHKYNQQQQHFMQQAATKNFSQVPPSGGGGGPPPPPMQFAGVPPRKIVGQRSQPPGNNQYRTNSMFNNGFASPPPSSSSSSSSSGSTIVRPNNMHSYNNNNNNIPEKSNFFQNFSSMSISGGNPNDQDMEYNPFQSKISFDNNMWGNNAQQPIPWQ